jgi:hypothetical protein
MRLNVAARRLRHSPPEIDALPQSRFAHIGECGAAAGNFVKTAAELQSPAIGPAPANAFQIYRVAAPHSLARSVAPARRRTKFSLISSILMLSFS